MFRDKKTDKPDGKKFTVAKLPVKKEKGYAIALDEQKKNHFLFPVGDEDKKDIGIDDINEKSKSGKSFLKAEDKKLLKDLRAQLNSITDKIRKIESRCEFTSQEQKKLHGIQTGANKIEEEDIESWGFVRGRSVNEFKFVEDCLTGRDDKVPTSEAVNEYIEEVVFPQVDENLESLEEKISHKLRSIKIPKAPDVSKESIEKKGFLTCDADPNGLAFISDSVETNAAVSGRGVRNFVNGMFSSLKEKFARKEDVEKLKKSFSEVDSKIKDKISLADVKEAYEANPNTNAFTDNNKAKLKSLDFNADKTTGENVKSSGAVMKNDPSPIGMSFVSDSKNAKDKLLLAQTIIELIEEGKIKSLSELGVSTKAHKLDEAVRKVEDSSSWADITNTDSVRAAGAIMHGETDATKVSFATNNLKDSNKVPTAASVVNYVKGEIKDSKINKLEQLDTKVTGAELDKMLDLIEALSSGKKKVDTKTNGLVTTKTLNAKGLSFVLDEPDLASNSSTKLATQRSIKAYIDARLSKLSQKNG